MIELTNGLYEAARAVWRRRWIGAAVAWSISLAAAVVVFFVPNRYEADAKIFVDTQSVLKPLMVGLAFQPDTDQQVRMLAKTLISRPNVQRLLELPEVQATELARGDRDKVIDRLIDRIKVVSAAPNLYTISLRDTNPAGAKSIVVGLVEMFVGSGTDSKRRDSEEAGKFIDDQIKTYAQTLATAESKVKDFKVRNFGVSGVSNQDYFMRMSALADEANRLRVALAGAEQSRDALKRELSQEDPSLPVEVVLPAAPPPLPTETELRLDVQRRQLDELLRRYTDEHPDVLNARRIIVQLEAQRRVEVAAAARAKASEVKPSGKAATSPVFQKIRIALAEAEANVASLHSQLSIQQQRLSEIRATASKVPQAEADLAQLTRDYDVVRKNYEQLVARREAASLGVKIDQTAQMVEFRIVEPPRVLPTPVFPDRRVLALLSMLAALAGGVMVAYGLSRAAPTYGTVLALQAAIKRPVLGSVTTFQTAGALSDARKDRMSFGMAMTAFFICNCLWILASTRIAYASSLPISP